ncbi:hypothetical protein O3M35_005133 [Rhynocoris fuscipes]|uniref:COMM domain-containing protein n=1 Tax=Rhynocoris fuscipes TaxID=488301 RepID=A0AAW1DN23_9HEMI
MASEICDIDWQFGVIAASNEENLVGKTFVQLKLTISTGTKVERFNTELTVEQFYSLLHDLEKARNILSYS